MNVQDILNAQNKGRFQPMATNPTREMVANPCQLRATYGNNWKSCFCQIKVFYQGHKFLFGVVN
jgi:hypothetical protein